MRHTHLDFERIAVFLVFLFYISTNAFWGYRLFHDNNLFAGLACIIPTLCFLISFRNSTSSKISTIHLLSVAMYMVIVISSGFSAKMILFYGMCTIMLFDAKISENPKYLKMFYYISFIFLLGTFIYLYFPGIYESRILPSFVGSSQYARLVKWTNRTVYLIVPGFTNQTSFNACHFIYGLGYLFCSRFAGEKFNIRKIIIAILLFISLVLTNKRAHFLFLFLALIVVYYMIGDESKRIVRIASVIAIGVLVIAGLYILISNVRFGVFIKLRQTLIDFENDEDLSGARGNLGSLAISYFLENPIFGIGWENFGIKAGNGMHTHNIYLQLLCETGIVGFSCFVSFFVYSLTTAIRNCKLAITQEERTAAGFCLFMQVFFLLYGTTGNPMYDPPYYIPYFFCCAYSIHKRYVPVVKTLPQHMKANAVRN